MESSCDYLCIKRAVVVFNVFFWFTGPSIFSLGTWYMVNIQLYSPIVDQNSLIFPAYTIMAGGIAITIFGIVGCMGAMNDNKCYMSFFFTCVLLAFGCEVFATVKSFLVYETVSPSIAMRLEKSMKYSYHYTTVDTEVINSIQEELQCCGRNNYTDWQHYRYYNDLSQAETRGRETVPHTCCIDNGDTLCNHGIKVPRNTSKIFNKGCNDMLSNWVKKNMKIFGWTCFAMAVLQIIGLVLCCCFCRAMKESNEIV